MSRKSFLLSLVVILATLFGLLWPPAFRPPAAAARLRAASSLDGLSPASRWAFEADDRLYDPIPAPAPGDWLAKFFEAGQTYEGFIAGKPIRLDAVRRKLYLLRLGPFDKGDAPSLRSLREFAGAFFMMDVEILEPCDVEHAAITRRTNAATGRGQLLTRDILTLLKSRLPPDAYALLGITMEDLYPAPSWDFVFGQALLRERVGVYSFARLDPAFYGQERGADWRSLMLRRSCGVLAHETAHMFGIKHCIYYRCLINGSNSLAESDSQPLRPCPVDLRKLYWSIGFDPLTRARRLRAFYVKVGLEDEARWLDRVISSVVPSKTVATNRTTD